MSHREALDQILDQYLDGSLTFDRFAEQYSTYYLEKLPDTGLTPGEFDRYGAIHERLEWTSPAPSIAERSVGWSSIDEFRTWLQVHRQGQPENH